MLVSLFLCTIYTYMYRYRRETAAGDLVNVVVCVLLRFLTGPTFSSEVKTSPSPARFERRRYPAEMITCCHGLRSVTVPSLPSPSSE